MKKEVFLYISFAVLSLVFIVISLLLKWNHKNPKLISRKIKLGATLLTLTSILSSCSGPQKGAVTCYDVASPDTNFKEIKKDTLTNEALPLKKDSIGINSTPNRATCYGAPANLNMPENE